MNGSSRRPTGLTLLAIYDFAGATLALVLSIALAVVASTDGAIVRAIGVSSGILAVVSLLRFVAGWGLLSGADWGRRLHLALSALSVLNLPVGTTMAIVSFVFLRRRHVVLWFSKPDSATWTIEESALWHSVAGGALSCRAVASTVGVVLVTTVGLIGMVASVVIPNLVDALDRKRSKQTVVVLREIGRALDAYAVHGGAYPALGESFVPIAELRPFLEPAYLQEVSAKDGWGNPMFAKSDGSSYTLASAGKDGIPDVEGFAYGEEDLRATDTFDGDCVFANGGFVRIWDGFGLGRRAPDSSPRSPKAP